MLAAVLTVKFGSQCSKLCLTRNRLNLVDISLSSSKFPCNDSILINFQIKQHRVTRYIQLDISPYSIESSRSHWSEVMHLFLVTGRNTKFNVPPKLCHTCLNSQSFGALLLRQAIKWLVFTSPLKRDLTI